MNVGLSMYSVHRRCGRDGWTVRDFLEYCRQQNISSVELLDLFWLDVYKELPETIAFLHEYGMTVSAYDVHNDFASPDASVRQAGLSSVRAGLEMANALKTRSVRIFAGNVAPGIDFAAAREWVVEGLRAAAQLAEEFDVQLVLENHGQLAGRSEQVEALLADVGSKYLTCAFDTGNFLLVADHPLPALERLRNVIGHVHVKDFALSSSDEGLLSTDGRRYRFVPLGQGIVPIAEIVARLSQLGYDGTLSIEFEGEPDLSGIEHGLDVLRPLVATFTGSGHVSEDTARGDAR
ncbi:MAG: sugar phosphate isomerase/epimerase [Alicyclobacillaceae bacterium]|nr:sugar phosphate isomerase/epimerase [Alicyclobacillaceae bacterium]